MKPKPSADPIREFYTNHPYPPPLENLDRAREVYRDENVVRAEYLFDKLWWHDQVVFNASRKDINGSN